MKASYSDLISANQAYAKAKTDVNPEYFSEMAKGQSPGFLWLGCSDSRVPANEVTGTESGDIFVHRNIDNMVVSTDLNFMSVLAYAVHHLKVDHIIVCGHYGCGGVQAALSNDNLSLLNKWLRNIKEVYNQHTDELGSLSGAEQVSRLVELNVAAQVMNVAKTTIVQEEWMARPLSIHGWVYDLKTGLVNDLGIDITGPEALPEIFRLQV
jgi:carbonic anhydrase